MIPLTAGGGLWVKEPVAVEVINHAETMIAGSVVFAFIAMRWKRTMNWRKLPYNQWMILGIFGSSWLYILLQAVLASPQLGLNQSSSVCEAATFICLALHLWSKVFLFMYLIERAEVVRGVKDLKFTKSKLKMFNAFMMSIYSIWIVLYFVFRIAYVERGLCIIGVKRSILIPTVVTEVLLNTYLTVLFVGPVLKSSKFNRSMNQKRSIASGNIPVSPHDAITSRLQKLAKRSFWGSAIAQLSMVANLGTLIFFDGEPAWLCLLCCKTDILVCAIVVYWMVSSDNLEEDLSKRSNSTPLQSRTFQSRSARQGPYGYSNGYSMGRDPADEEAGITGMRNDLEIAPRHARMGSRGLDFELSPVSRKEFQSHMATTTNITGGSIDGAWDRATDAGSMNQILQETTISVERVHREEKRPPRRQ